MVEKLEVEEEMQLEEREKCWKAREELGLRPRSDRLWLCLDWQQVSEGPHERSDARQLAWTGELEICGLGRIPGCSRLHE